MNKWLLLTVVIVVAACGGGGPTIKEEPKPEKTIKYVSGPAEIIAGEERQLFFEAKPAGATCSAQFPQGFQVRQEGCTLMYLAVGSTVAEGMYEIKNCITGSDVCASVSIPVKRRMQPQIVYTDSLSVLFNQEVDIVPSLMKDVDGGCTSKLLGLANTVTYKSETDPDVVGENLVSTAPGLFRYVAGNTQFENGSTTRSVEIRCTSIQLGSVPAVDTVHIRRVIPPIPAGVRLHGELCERTSRRLDFGGLEGATVTTVRGQFGTQVGIFIPGVTEPVRLRMAALSPDSGAVIKSAFVGGQPRGITEYWDVAIRQGGSGEWAWRGKVLFRGDC